MTNEQLFCEECDGRIAGTPLFVPGAHTYVCSLPCFNKAMQETFAQIQPEVNCARADCSKMLPGGKGVYIDDLGVTVCSDRCHFEILREKTQE